MTHPPTPSPRRKPLLVLLVGMLSLFLTLSFLLPGCSHAHDPWEDAEGEGPKVLASFPPLYCFAKKVGGDHAKVLSLLAAVGPHDYQPKSRDAQKAVKADLFLVNGLGLDDFITVIKNSSGNQELKVVKVGNELAEKLIIPVAHHPEDDHHGHSHGPYDPHIWLGIPQARAMVEVIKKELSELAPKHQEYYSQNAQAFLKELDELEKYGQKLKDKQNRKIITTHDSLDYFAKSFGLDVPKTLMPQPGVQPKADVLTKLVAACLDPKEPVRVITVEPQYSDKAAQVLLGAIKAKVKDEKQLPKLVSFDTLETAPPDFTADFYISKMRENIDELAKNLP